MAVKVGSGFDVHRLVEGRELILGGVKIDSPVGLLGHSDADVLTHSLCDAILGALGLGDIGEHYPDSDPRFKGISSLALLADVVEKMKQRHYEIINCDLTLIAETPKISPYKEEIKKTLSDVLKVDINRINLKATTCEGLGFVGRREGVAAMSSVLIGREE